MSIRKALAALAVPSFAVALLAGCSPSASDPGPDDGPTSANVYLYQKPATFNPLKPAQGGEQVTMSLIYDNLFSTGPDFDYIPRLAEEWEISEDATIFTFRLREGLTWSDGEPFTADDVVFSYTLYADPAVGSAWGARLADVEGYDELMSGAATELAGVRAVDDTTVEFRLGTPNAGFMSLIGYGPVFHILPEHILGEEDRAGLLENDFFDMPTVGMGPYVMEEFNIDQDVVLTANENFRTDVGIDTLYLKMLTSDVATAQLATGEIDLVQVSALDVGAVEGLTDVTVSSKPSAAFTRMAVNTSKPRFQDERVRQAFMYAIDRQGIIDGVLGGNAQTINSTIMSPWALPDDLEEYAYDPERAKQLLAEAGFDGTTPVELSWIPGQRDRDQMVNVIIENLQAAGVNAVAKQVDGGALTASYGDGTYDLALFGGGVYTPDPASSFAIVACDQHYPTGGNISWFCDEELDAVMREGALVADVDSRAEIYQDAARLDNRLVPYIWLNVPDTIWAASDRLKGFEPHGDFTNGFWNAADWKIVE